MDVVNLEKISLRDHWELNEAWLQSRIAEDPSILGLGPLILIDLERTQKRPGRLDLLLQDPESARRYEVEIQIGKTDETHIIRTIEYWAFERKQFPQEDHCAVIIAEEITSRFLNVIGLLGGGIPLIAIEMSAFKIGEKIGLHFTTVLSDSMREIVDEDDGIQEPADRQYWELRASPQTVGMADQLFDGMKKLESSLEMKFYKQHIGLGRRGVPSKVALFKPRKAELLMELKIAPSAEIEKLIEGSGLVLMDAGVSERGRYRLRLTQRNLDRNDAVLFDLIKRAFESGRG
jgi:hypothetical protein